MFEMGTRWLCVPQTKEVGETEFPVVETGGTKAGKVGKEGILRGGVGEFQRTFRVW